MPRGIADERDPADRTVTPTGNKTKMNGFVEISTLLIHSAPKQKSNEWMHLSPFYTRMHGEWLRYAKSTSQFHWRFLLVRDVRGFQVNPLCRHDITRSDRQIGNCCSVHQCFHEMYSIMFNKPLLMIGPSIVPTIPFSFHKHTTEMSVTLDVLYTMPALTDIIVKVCPGQIIYK